LIWAVSAAHILLVDKYLKYVILNIGTDKRNTMLDKNWPYIEMSAKDTQTKLKNWQPNPDLTEKELDVMREDVLDRITIARVGLLLRHPFFGNMATRLRVVCADDWCGTAAVDGRNLYFNTQFFNEMTNKEIEFVIAHEILHCVFDHLGRRNDRNPLLYNIAADYKVNNLLVRDRIGEKPKFVDCYQDFKYEEWTSEEIYDELFEEAKKNGEEFLKQLGEMLDEHLDLEGDGDEEQGSDGKSKRPKYSKSELDQIKDEVKEAMINAAQTAGAGNVPAGVERLIKELTEPKMNWRELLRQQIQSTIKSDYTFARPSRKGWHTGAILPGMNFAETIDICVSIDMSGSIGDDQAKDFLSEVNGIMEEYKDYKIKVWCFDTAVYNEADFSADGGESLDEYTVKGGGGTDFVVNWNYMKERDITPKKFIMFTDGYAWDSWGDPDYCDTIFVIHSNHDKNLQAPFGMTAHYEEAA
jgi:predicted metal-dependent peptidase